MPRRLHRFTGCLAPLALGLFLAAPAQAAPIIGEGEVIDWDCVMLMGSQGYTFQQAIMLCTYTPAQNQLFSGAAYTTLNGFSTARSGSDKFLYRFPGEAPADPVNYYADLAGAFSGLLFSVTTVTGERMESGSLVPFTDTTITSQVAGLSFVTTDAGGGQHIAPGTGDLVAQSYTSLASGASLLMGAFPSGASDGFAMWRFDLDASTAYHGYFRVNSDLTIGLELGLSLPNESEFVAGSIPYTAYLGGDVPEPGSMAAIGAVAAAASLARRHPCFGRTKDGSRAT